MDFLNYMVGGRGKVELESNKTKQKSMASSVVKSLYTVIQVRNAGLLSLVE
jgi:hypothetical protein